MKALGSAPGIQKLKQMNKLGVGKAAVSWGTLWYYFRNYYPIIVTVLIIIFCVVPFFTSNTINGHLLYGGFLSLASTSMVCLSYYQVVPWRKHPSPLILYRTLSNMIFSLIIVINALHFSTIPGEHANHDDELTGEQGESCQAVSFVTQFAVITSECWLLTFSVDLLKSLTNPFSSYTWNLKQYHIFIWSFGFLNALALVGNNPCQGVFTAGVCWMNIDSPFSPCLWGYYLFWTMAFFAFSIAVIAYSYVRIHKGLEVTFMTRKAIVSDTFRVVFAYMLYMSIIGLMYIIMASYTHKQNPKDDVNKEYTSSMAKTVEKLTAYFIACRGLVDASLWFVLHDFDNDPPAVIAKIREKTHIGKFIQLDPEAAARGERPRRMSVEATAAESPEVDLTPQLNMALRQEVVHFVTVGIQESVLSRNSPGHGESVSFMVDGRYRFTDFAAIAFHELRALHGIGEESYLDQISRPGKEKLSEGASGAFMFYCGSDFIVKTVKKSEARVLLNILPTYKRHLEANPNSLLVRFYGLHSLKMYSQEFNFVVMGNIFPKHAIINERYDIKGSWVNRNAGVAAPGMKAVCRHCSETFIVGAPGGCPEIVGPHEANIVLKDNDLTTKIRMRPEDAFSLIDIINKDSDVLAQLGIMDYSLLIGVRNLQYDVDPEHLIRKLSTSYDGTGPPPLAITNLRMLLENGGLNGSSLSRTDSGSEKAEAASAMKRNYSNISLSALSVSGMPKETSTPPSLIKMDEVQKALGGYLTRAVIAPGVYYMGIIDILQTWTLRKRIERWAKVYLQGKSADGLSVMHPVPYKDRFQHKVSQLIEHSIFVREVTGSWLGKREVAILNPLAEKELNQEDETKSTTSHST